MKSPLELKEYFFPVAQVVAEPDMPNDVDVNDNAYVIGTNVQKSESSDVYQVAVEISSPPDEEKSKQAYKIHIIVVGVFRVAENWPDKEKLLRVTGSSILYSAAREFLITITSRGPYGAVTLPTISFNFETSIEVEKDPKKPAATLQKRKKKKSSVE